MLGYFSIGFCGEVVISSDAFPWLPMPANAFCHDVTADPSWMLGLAVDGILYN
jgi:hypothetical protein